MFFDGSRYQKVESYLFRRRDQSEVLLKKKRDIPQARALLIHAVQEGERTDILAQRYYRDALKFWKMADGNEELNPEQLLAQPGAKILVPPNDPD
jgi:hypothetical protein